MLLCMISYSVMSCVLHVQYCNHFFAVDMAGVACRGLCMRVVRKMSILGFHPYMPFHFLFL